MVWSGTRRAAITWQSFALALIERTGSNLFMLESYCRCYYDSFVSKQSWQIRLILAKLYVAAVRSKLPWGMWQWARQYASRKGNKMVALWIYILKEILVLRTHIVAFWSNAILMLSYFSLTISHSFLENYELQTGWYVFTVHTVKNPCLWSTITTSNISMSGNSCRWKAKRGILNVGGIYSWSVMMQGEPLAISQSQTMAALMIIFVCCIMIPKCHSLTLVLVSWFPSVNC